MKNFSKYLYTATAAAMALSMAGCSSSSAAASTAASTATAATSTATAAADDATAGFEDELVKANTLTVAISPDYPPYESYATDGSLQGFDVDMGNSLVQYFGSDYKIEFVSMSFDTIITAVQSGQVDLGISGFTYDADRQVAFSDPYLTSAEVVLVQKDSGITTIDDLKGKSLAAQSGSTGETAANTVEGATVTTGTDAQVLIEALKTGAYDGVVLDQPVAQNYVDSNSDSFAIVEEPLLTENTCIIAKQGNDALVAKVNEALASYMATDAYTENKTKWELDQ